MPAHFCGIAGLKPTTGRIPRSGHFPQMGGVTGGLSAAGPMARSSRDLALVLPLLCGPDDQDPGTQPVPLGDPAHVDLQALRVACFTDNGIFPCHPDCAAAVEEGAEALRRLGLTVTQARPAGLETSVELLFSLFQADGGVRLRTYLARIGTRHLSTGLARMLDAMEANALSSADLMTALGRIDTLRTGLLAFFQRYDLLLCPPAALPAPMHGTLIGPDGPAILSYAMLANLGQLPAISIPWLINAQHLPVGLQILAAPWREDRVLAAAIALETTRGPWQAPPLDSSLPKQV